MEAHTLGATLKNVKQNNQKSKTNIKQKSNKMSNRKGAPEIFRNDVMYIMV